MGPWPPNHQRSSAPGYINKYPTQLFFIYIYIYIYIYINSWDMENMNSRCLRYQEMSVS